MVLLCCLLVSGSKPTKAPPQPGSFFFLCLSARVLFIPMCCCSLRTSDVESWQLSPCCLPVCRTTILWWWCCIRTKTNKYDTPHKNCVFKYLSLNTEATEATWVYFSLGWRPLQLTDRIYGQIVFLVVFFKDFLYFLPVRGYSSVCVQLSECTCLPGVCRCRIMAWSIRESACVTQRITAAWSRPRKRPWGKWQLRSAALIPADRNVMGEISFTG